MARDSQGRGSGRSYFGEISDRLRRFLGVDGAWPIEIGPQVSPVVLVGDATTAGMSPFVGRRFGVSRGPTATAAGNIAYLQATTDRGMIIDQVILSQNLAGSYRLSMGSPGAQLAAPSADVSILIDNASTAGPERAGVDAHLGSIAAPAARTVLAEVTLVINTPFVFDFGAEGRGIFLPQWGYLALEITAGAPNITLSAFGRVPQSL